jgi:hypothetical protein
MVTSGCTAVLGGPRRIHPIDAVQAPIEDVAGAARRRLQRDRLLEAPGNLDRDRGDGLQDLRRARQRRSRHQGDRDQREAGSRSSRNV